MLLDHYVSAMDSWKGRIDSETDYDAFRWHQWVQPIDLNDGSAPFTGKLGFAFIGFCSDKGVARNKGRTGTALAPDFVRGQMSGLPCTFSQEVKLYDAGDIICDEISLEEGQRELGCAVTAIDLTRAMLAEAKENAGPLADGICFMEMNAEALSFAPERFDAVISRNLTWNLPHPDRAYAEWTRVLKKGGVLLNFDANWYAYLFDEDAQAAWDRDRRSSAERGVWDQNVEAEGEHFDVMEEIARRVPLSKIARPAWDLQQLASLGMKAEADETVWKRVWSEEETISFASTPMFLVRGRK